MEVATEFVTPVGQDFYKPHYEQYGVGDWYQSNWIGCQYRLGPNKVLTIHTGDDILLHGATAQGKVVKAVANGRIIYAHDTALPSTWGNVMVIAHLLPDGHMVYSRYGHLNSFFLGKDSDVQAGEEIGSVGDAHHQLVAHLHFDIGVTPLLASNPINWPGLNRSFIFANYTAPLDFMQSWNNPTLAPISVTTEDYLNVRLEASRTSNLIGTTGQGEKITVFWNKQSNGYVKLAFQTGWVLAGYCKR